MKYSIAVLVLTVIVGCRQDAPYRSNRAFYFPTAVGDTWIYDGNGVEDAYTVRKVEEKDEGKVVSVSRVLKGGADDLSPPARYLVAPNGVFSLLVASSDVDPLGCILRLPHVDGGKWEQTDSRLGLTWRKASRTAYGPEQVTVPAGTFEAIRVEVESGQREGPPMRVTIWYAAGVGEIKRVQSSIMVVMKSFSSGKQ